MKKSDLKDGMVVENRSGNRFIVVGNAVMGTKNWYSMDDFDENLNVLNYKNLDICKVYKKFESSLDHVLGGIESNLIWKREEVDWNKVPAGTKVLVSDNCGEEHVGYFINIISAEYFKFHALINKGNLYESCYWENCKLLEEPKKEVTFDDIDKKMRFYCTNHIKSCNQACDICVAKNILENYNVTIKNK